METNQIAIHRWMNKEDGVHIHNGILLSHLKYNNASFSHMDGSGGLHTKWSKSDRKRQILNELVYIQNIKKLYKWIYLHNRTAHRARKWINGYQWRRMGGRIDWEFGIDMYTLLYLK